MTKEELEKKCKCKCRMCGKTSTYLTIDHIVPQAVFKHTSFRDNEKNEAISKNGIHGDNCNWTLLCQECNRKKGDSILTHHEMRFFCF